MQDVNGTPQAQVWAVTTDFVGGFEVLQHETVHEGPCITCVQSRRPVVSGSLGNDRRWPRFGGRVARMGVHAGLALPLLVEDTVVGAINCYSRDRDAFAEHAVQLGTQFAGAAAVCVYNAQLLTQGREREERLHRALGNRSIIDQAIGIIRSELDKTMAYTGCRSVDEVTTDIFFGGRQGNRLYERVMDTAEL